uniref:60S ribosomal export protein NMD3 OB-fold domain-containing protein n=1 Tax=Clastoptera arizonana TaxID=38151 RepID=A0A1B6DMT1_9HEMI
MLLKSFIVAEITSDLYWRNPFLNICVPKHLVPFIVIDIEVIEYKSRKNFPGMGAVSNKHLIADAWVVKASELGISDGIFTRTHLGHILKPGDLVAGYLVAEANINNEHFDKLSSNVVPDVVLVKKMYSDRATRRNKRKWQLKHLTVNDGMHPYRENNDYDEFLAELEEDPDARKQINIYKDPAKIAKPVIPVDASDIDDPNAPIITLDEMLDDLVIDDSEMAEMHE